MNDDPLSEVITKAYTNMGIPEEKRDFDSLFIKNVILLLQEQDDNEKNFLNEAKTEMAGLYRVFDIGYRYARSALNGKAGLIPPKDMDDFYKK